MFLCLSALSISCHVEIRAHLVPLQSTRDSLSADLFNFLISTKHNHPRISGRNNSNRTEAWDWAACTGLLGSRANHETVQRIWPIFAVASLPGLLCSVLLLVKKLSSREDETPEKTEKDEFVRSDWNRKPADLKKWFKVNAKVKVIL